MKSRKQKLIVIVGPTASGKSELAVKIAKKFNGEIISADSRQIYQDLDIGTGKVPGRWIKNVPSKERPLANWNFLYKGIPHHCIDFVSPKKTYNVAEFKKCAESAIADITARGKIPIVAGGTGFWIDTVVYDLNIPEVPPDNKLRGKLEKKSTRELLKLLIKLDPRRAKTIEQKNPRRLIRAIEIAKALGKVPELKRSSPYELLWIGVKPGDKVLHKKIHKRLLKRMREGIASEAKILRKKGLPWKRFYELGLEYKALADLLQKKLTAEETVIALEYAINDYARRQMVWFKKNKNIRWIRRPDDATAIVKNFIERPRRSR